VIVYSGNKLITNILVSLFGRASDMDDDFSIQSKGK